MDYILDEDSQTCLLIFITPLTIRESINIKSLKVNDALVLGSCQGNVNIFAFRQRESFRFYHGQGSLDARAMLDSHNITHRNS